MLVSAVLLGLLAGVPAAAQRVPADPPAPVVVRSALPSLVPPQKDLDEPDAAELERWRARQRMLERLEKDQGPAVRHAAERAGLAAKEGTDRVLIILVEFGGRDTFEFFPEGPNKSTWDPLGKPDESEWTGTIGDCSAIIRKHNIAGPTRFTFEGPLHNHIERPRGTADEPSRSLIWTADFNPGYYQDISFGNGVQLQYQRKDGSEVSVDLTGKSVRNYYTDMSGGRYSIEGEVVGWVKVPHSVWWYAADPCPGARSVPAGIQVGKHGAIPRAGNLQTLVVDTLTAVKADYPDFDWTRYDQDKDGFVDRLWIIHAGLGEEDDRELLRRTDYGEGQVWSHASRLTTAHEVAPGIKVSRYIMMPENAGAAVLAHEFGHNLGAIDLYAYYGGSTSAGFWTVMADDWTGDPIGSVPPAFDPWHLDQWGWLSPLVISDPFREYVVKVGQASRFPGGGDVYRGVKIRLPDGRATLPVAPLGQHFWWSGRQELTNSTMTLAAPLSLPAAPAATLSFSTAYNIETSYDFLFVQVSADGGQTWKTLTNAQTTCRTAADWIGPRHGFPADLCAAKAGGFTGTNPGYPKHANQEFDLSEFAGRQILLRFWYLTDASVTLWGAFVDHVRVTAGSQQVFFDDAERGDANWRYAGAWQRNDGLFTYTHQYYLQWRNTTATGGFDSALSAPGWRFAPAGAGLLVWYNNNRYSDNEVADYLFDYPSYGPKGKMLVVDAHPEPYRDPALLAVGFDNEAANLRSRMQMRDAAFSLNRTPAFTAQANRSLLERTDTGAWVRQDTRFSGRPAVSRFGDSLGYYPGLELVVPGPAGSSESRQWMTRQWDSSVVLPSTKAYPVLAPGARVSAELLSRLTTALANGQPQVTRLGEVRLLSGDGGGGDPGEVGGQYGWHVEILSQTDGQATLRIWNDAKGYRPRLAAVNGASFAAGPVAPGSVVSIFGANLARATGAATAVPLPRLLEATTVSIDGFAAPLFYVSPGQINAQAPYEVKPGKVMLAVTGEGQERTAGVLEIAEAAPGIAVSGNRAITLNQNGTLNTVASPAPAGSIVVVFMTGQGLVDQPVETGGPAPNIPLARPLLRVSLTVGGRPARVHFAGLTLYSVGLMQVNLEVPDLPAGDHPVVVTIGGKASNAALIAVSGR